MIAEKTATPAALLNGTATGFSFVEATAPALRNAIDRALALWPDRAAWSQLIRTAMRMDWSWDRIARSYRELYEEVHHCRAAGRTAV